MGTRDQVRSQIGGCGKSFAYKPISFQRSYVVTTEVGAGISVASYFGALSALSLGEVMSLASESGAESGLDKDAF